MVSRFSGRGKPLHSEAAQRAASARRKSGQSIAIESLQRRANGLGARPKPKPRLKAAKMIYK
jgi:hypothetical protein